MRQSRRSAIAVAALLVAALGAPAAAATTPSSDGSGTTDSSTSSGDSAGTVTRLPNVPNWFRDDPVDYCTTSDCSTDPNPDVDVFADPANNLLFETDLGAAQGPPGCWSTAARPLIAMDADTYQPLAFGCGGTRAGGTAGGASTNSPLVGIDSADGLLFFSGDQSDVSSGSSADTVEVVSEKTLHVVATWTLPAMTASGSTAHLPSPPSIMGLSWQASGDQLVVLTGYSRQFLTTKAFLGLPSGVDVAVYDVAATMKAVTAPTTPVNAMAVAAGYPLAVPGCADSMALHSQFATADAHLSNAGDHLFVPCDLQGSTEEPFAGSTTPGVVRFDIADGAPTGASTVTSLPGSQVGDFLFDDGSNRAFVPVQTFSGTIVYVYDGDLGKLVGENAIVPEAPGENNPDFNCVAMTVDQTSGRFYGLAPTGFFFFDGRRVSIAGSQNFQDLAMFVQYQTDAVLPPDSVYAFPRVIMNYQAPAQDGTTCSQATATTRPTSFAVFGDQTAPSTVGGDFNPDSATFTGDIPDGYPVSVTYRSHANAAGAHTDWAGSYGGATNNITNGTGINGDFLPFGGGIRDILQGWVEDSSLSDGSPLAAATGVGDGNSHTAADLTACSNPSAPDGCPHPAPPSQFPAPPQPPDSGGSGGFGQAWPFGTAECPIPTDSGMQNQSTASGYAVTNGTDADGNPQQQTLPNSDNAATASVDCAPSTPAGGVAASAAARGVSASQGPGGPGVAVAEATSTTSQSPAQAGGPTVSQAAAAARGIRVDTGQGVLEIGAVEQSAMTSAAGRPGTAKAARAVVIAGVSITAPEGSTHVICGGVCPDDQSAVDQINAAFPGLINVTLPEPDSPYGAVTKANGIETIPGSPGGFIAAVQAPPSEQSTNVSLFGYPTDDSEASLLPGLRVRIAPPNIAEYQLDYMVVDLAPVATDSTAGVSVSCPDGSFAPDPDNPLVCQQFDTGSADAGSVGDTGGDQGNAGTPGTPATPGTPGTPPTKGHYVTGSKGRFVAGAKGHFVPGTPAAPSFVPAQVTESRPISSALLQQPAQPPLLAGGIPGLVKRVFHGFSLLARSPAEAAKFFGLLLLLAIPVLMAARRRQWVRSTEVV